MRLPHPADSAGAREAERMSNVHSITMSARKHLLLPSQLGWLAINASGCLKSLNRKT